jgi:hypothetical protein
VSGREFSLKPELEGVDAELVSSPRIVSAAVRPSPSQPRPDLGSSGGGGRRPASPATVRAYISMVRACAHELGLDDAVDGARVPRHEPGHRRPLTDADYANLVRVPDQRTRAGRSLGPGSMSDSAVGVIGSRG